MKIIGHRGARGLVDENTVASVRRGLAEGADGVEFDVWTTIDGIPVVGHDRNFKRMTGVSLDIPKSYYSEIKQLETLHGHKIPTAKGLIDEIGDHFFIFEIKDHHLTKPVLQLLDQSSSKNFTVTSYNKPALLELKKSRPNMGLYAATDARPLKTIHFAARHNLAGVTLNKMSFTPLAYWAARHNDLRIRLFTVNSKFYMRLIKLLSLRLDIITDYPDRAKEIFKKS